MVLLSAGMQKSGSGWYFNLTNDLLVAAGLPSVHEIRDRHNLHWILRHDNCNLGRPTWLKLIWLYFVSRSSGSFVVKLHSEAPSRFGILASGRLIRASYIYRDPRDAACSAFEHGEKLRSYGESHTFAKLSSMKEAIVWAKQLVPAYDSWKKCKKSVLLVRYEDLLENTTAEMIRLAKFLGLDLSTEAINAIIQKYNPDNLNNDQKNFLHYNKGVSGRFREVMSKDELSLSNELLGEHLTAMGYEI